MEPAGLWSNPNLTFSHGDAVEAALGMLFQSSRMCIQAPETLQRLQQRAQPVPHSQISKETRDKRPEVTAPTVGGRAQGGSAATEMTQIKQNPSKSAFPQLQGSRVMPLRALTLFPAGQEFAGTAKEVRWAAPLQPGKHLEAVWSALLRCFRASVTGRGLR